MVTSLDAFSMRLAVRGEFKQIIAAGGPRGVFVECHCLALTHSFRFVSWNAIVRSSLLFESKTRISHERKHARVSA
jgi:hypothetical protein